MELYVAFERSCGILGVFDTWEKARSSQKALADSYNSEYNPGLKYYSNYNWEEDENFEFVIETYTLNKLVE